MTQEIYGYFLIRSTIMNNEKEALINAYSDKGSFAYFIQNVAKLIEEDDFFLTSQELVERAEAVLYEYRFKYNKDKEINDDMNKIINKFREYKNMSIKETSIRYRNWLQKEGKLRGVPKIFSTPDLIYDSISKDFTNMTVIISTNGTLYPNDLLDYIMNVNYIANKFPVILLEDQIRDNIILNLEITLEEAKKILFAYSIRGYILKKYIKDTINNLKSLSKEINEELTSDEKQKIKSIENN